MSRKGKKVRFFDRVANQVGPEHANVLPAMAWALANGWSTLGDAQELNESGPVEPSSNKKPAPSSVHIIFIP